MAVKSIGGPPIYYEYDDAIYMTPLHKEKLELTLKLAKGVIVGNPWLAAWARSYNKNVHIVPTVVDTEKLQPKSDYSLKKPVRIGWIGQPYNFPMIETVGAALQRVGAKTRIELVVISARGFRLPGVKTRLIKWSLETEADALKSLDIGIMPLFDDEWSKGKCGAKLLQYMAAGVPAIATPVGVNKTIADFGEAALLPETEDEWVGALETLIESETLRRELAERARKKVEEEYSLTVWAPKLAELYKTLAAK